MPATGPRRPGCDNCRARHLKCDGGKPCAQCARKKIKCSRNLRVRFRHHSSSAGLLPEFPDSQVWCKVSGKRLKFLDQNLEIASNYEDSSESESEEHSQRDEETPASAKDIPDQVSKPESSIRRIDSTLTRVSGDKFILCSSAGFPSSHPNTLASINEPSTSIRQVTTRTIPSDFIDAEPWVFSLEHRSPSIYSSALRYGSISSPSIAGTPPRKPAKAELFRYFVTNIGPAFDSYDPDKYFTETLPSEATRSQPLLDFILQVSAWHFYVTNGDLQQLIDLSPLVTSDIEGHALEATLLLQQFIFLRVSVSGAQSKYPLLADLPTAPLGSPLAHISDTVHDDVLWAQLRLQAFMAVFNQRSLSISSDRSRLEEITKSRDDRSRANKMLLGLIDVIQYCFGAHKSTSIYDKLLESTSAWILTNPPSFTPVMIRRRRPGENFPQIWLLNDCVAAGLQYYHLARILLLVYDPRAPQLCLARKEASKWVETQTMNDVEIICGIANSISATNPMHITACMAIATIGDRFNNKQQQQALFDILAKTSKRYGMWTEPTQKALLESWGGANAGHLSTGSF